MEFDKHFTKGVKGQASLEYLMTYGWAIVMISVVGVVVWQMGLLDPPETTPDCRGFSQIRPIDWKLNTAGDLTLVVINEANTKLNITKVTAEIETQAGSCSDSTNVGLSAGGTAKINLTGCPNGIHLGDYYRARINISYRNIASSMDHVSPGVCWSDVEQ